MQKFSKMLILLLQEGRWSFRVRSVLPHQAVFLVAILHVMLRVLSSWLEVSFLKYVYFPILMLAAALVTFYRIVAPHFFISWLEACAAGRRHYVVILFGHTMAPKSFVYS